MNASYMLASGVDLRTVSGRLGHSKPSTTSDIYSHLLRKTESEAANVMQSIFNLARQQATDAKKPAPSQAGN